MGRFINADAFISTGQGLLGNNMFAYCRNNPVRRRDVSGMRDDECVEDANEDDNPLNDLGGPSSGGGGTSSQVYSGCHSGGSGTPQVDGACFIAGTLVKAENGDVSIEEIEVGDYVWAWDEETGEVALKKVVETYINETAELIHVFVNGEEIITTPTHPFYSPVKGWTDAARLRAGDILILVNGEYVVVEKIQHEILETPIAVYNFQVEDFHTYYVADVGVLVHNTCRNPGGRHGGDAHRQRVQEIKDKLTADGWKVSSRESRVYINKNKYRYPDIIAEKGNAMQFYQIGRVTSSGIPVARERHALEDLNKITNTVFVAYF